MSECFGVYDVIQEYLYTKMASVRGRDNNSESLYHENYDELRKLEKDIKLERNMEQYYH